MTAPILVYWPEPEHVELARHAVRDLHLSRLREMVAERPERLPPPENAA